MGSVVVAILASVSIEDYCLKSMMIDCECIMERMWCYVVEAIQ
jgi:hypothetical protein